MTDHHDIDPGGGSHHVVVHFSDKFPIVRTACGIAKGPAAGLWRYVDCHACLAVAPSDPRIEERKRAVGWKPPGSAS